MKFKDIPQFTHPANYRINVPWNDIIHLIDRYTKNYKLEINPDFQRGHVWTEEQQIAYIEFKMSGGSGSNDLIFNCKGWMGDYDGIMVLVDGKQRLNAVLRFLNNEIKAFGLYVSEFEGKMPDDFDFMVNINNLKTRKQVLRWYLELNSGGTPHTKEELAKVEKMLINE